MCFAVILLVTQQETKIDKSMAGFSLVETHKDGNIKLRFQHSNTGRDMPKSHADVRVSVFAACGLLGSERCRFWNLRLTEGLAQEKKRHLGARTTVLS